MTARHALTWMLALALGFVASAAHSAEARRPNIVIILADDLGYADLGCQGCKDIPTPHIDALAKKGVRCTDAYATAPVDSPSRAALMTGRYPQRFGHEFNPPRDPKSAHGLPAKEKTIADVAKDAGYATGLIGKWHLGTDVQQHPLQRGFQEFFGFLGGAHYYVNPGAPARGVATPAPWPNGIQRGTKLVEEKEYLTDAFTREAVAFIDRQQKKPFFLLLSFNAPHTPLEASEKYLKRVIGGTGGDQRRRIYAAMIAALDDGVGAVTAKLKDAGIEQDTLIFFLSGNGGITGYLSPSSNRPLIGAKTELLEGGIRVPFITQWTGRLPAGTVYAQPISILDVLPTAIAAAGMPPPKNRALDGVDLLPYLSGKTSAAPHETLYWRYGPLWAVRQGSFKLLKVDKEPVQLFDLSADIGETRDLAKVKPDIVQRLTDEWNKWNAQLAAPVWNRPATAPWW